MICITEEEKQHLKNMNIKSLQDFLDTFEEIYSNDDLPCLICENIIKKINLEMFGGI